MRKKYPIAILFAAAGVVGAVLIVLRLYYPAALYHVNLLPLSTSGRAQPASINDRGQVAGLLGGFHRYRSDSLFLWEPGRALRDLGTFGYAIHGGSLRINDVGQIAVTVQDPNGMARVLLWDPNTGPHLLGTLGGTRDEVWALNNRGQVVGSSQIAGGLRHAVLWNGRAAVVDLGTLGGPDSLACSINDRGQVAGFAETASGWHAFLWDPNTRMRDLGPTSVVVPPGGGIHVNNRGLVVGRFGSATDRRLLCTWRESEGARPLVSVPGVEACPSALNDAGQLLVEVRSTEFDFRTFNTDILSEYYLWDPDHGLVLLRKRLGRRGIREQDFYLCDIDNQGRIVGGLGSQAVLLEPIAERWRK